MNLKTHINLSLLVLASRLSSCEEWKFPSDFKFGVSTSAYQIEGGWNADGRGLTIWDTATHNRSVLIADRSNGDIACDSYNKWNEDIRLLKILEVNFYRFSLSWVRILPNGYLSKVNEAGAQYYNNIINMLLENGIEPMVTLYHWDLPQMFSPLGGWSNSIVVDYFAHYARTVFRLFGDRVKTWITINEPRLVCEHFKGLIGDVTPPYPLGVVEYLCAKNVLKAHAEAYHIYDKEFRPVQQGRISITLDFIWVEPENKTSTEDCRIAEQAMQFKNGLYANPIFNLGFPQGVIDRVSEMSRLEGFPDSRLPQFTLAEKLKIKGTCDYLGINHYIAYTVRPFSESPSTVPSFDKDIGGDLYYNPTWKTTPAPWMKVTPWAFRGVFRWIKKNYGNPEIIVTESGYADDTDIFNDDERISYYKAYLNATLQAIIEDGVNVSTFIVWSLMDTFEWKEGYTFKFGLYHVNFTDPSRTRTPRKSANYFKNVVKTKSIT